MMAKATLPMSTYRTLFPVQPPRTAVLLSVKGLRVGFVGPRLAYSLGRPQAEARAARGRCLV
jgi:hypothetical protein